MTVPLLTRYRELRATYLTHDEAVQRLGVPRDSVETALRRSDTQLRAQTRPKSQGRDAYWRQRALWALIRRLQDADLLPPVLDADQQAAVNGLVLEAVVDLVDGEARNATAWTPDGGAP